MPQLLLKRSSIKEVQERVGRKRDKTRTQQAIKRCQPGIGPNTFAPVELELFPCKAFFLFSQSKSAAAVSRQTAVSYNKS
jgi:hypothetical protein